MASLFGENRLRERAQEIATADVQEYIDLVQTWLNDYDHGTLKQDKETSREGQYNQDFFINILGYKSSPATPETFRAQDTTDNNQYPDGTLRYTVRDTDVDNVFAVVELKGASIQLDRTQQREGNLSPVQQAFKYKPQYRSCPFVIVSNFWEFRLYNDTILDYEKWTLRDLVDPADDYLKFKQWYFLLQADNFVVEQGKSPTELFLSDIRQEQMDIGEEFYAEYREIRLELLRDIWRRNPGWHDRFAEAIQKAQTVIDRIVFVCFAEDSGLLPDHTLTRTIEFAENSPYQTMWEVFKGFFHSIGTGSAKLGIPNGYGGSLFYEDESLDSLDIGNDALRELASLGGKYDFQNDLTVTILGRIFEQSITDLESIREKVEKGEFDQEARKAPGRRKKEGVFYTPDYVVQYIIDRTVGDYLRGVEDELKAKHRLGRNRTEAGYLVRERRVYTEYQYVLQNLRVIDPACGSGAFLVGVFDFLLAENGRVDEILGGSLTSTEDFVRSILSDNIFGVDLNEESVELTKLSLWLKTAIKDKPLTSLDNNIKTGNSIIDDPDVADRYFDWDAEFPDVTSRGGFHAILCNPPYVRVQNLEQDHVDYFFERYEVPTGKLDISIIFFEKALEVVHEDGRAGFISSSQWMQTDYGGNLRKMLSSRKNLEEIIDFGSLPVFDDASTYPAIFIMEDGDYESVNYARIPSVDKLNLSSIMGAPRRGVSYDVLTDTAWSFGDYNLEADLTSRGVDYRPLSDVAHAYVGDLTGRDKTFVLTKERAAELGIEPAILYPYAYRAAEVKRWHQTEPGAVVIYPYRSGPDGEAVLLTPQELEHSYPRTYEYLLPDKEVLKERLDSRKLYALGDDWFRHLRAGSFDYIEPRKLIIKGIDKRAVVGFLDGNTAFNGANCPGILVEDASLSIEYLCGLINSRLISYALNQVCPPKLNNTFRYNTKNVNLIPIVGFSDEAVERDVRKLADLTREIGSVTDKFKTLVSYEYGVTWPAKLEDWWELDYPDLAKKIKLRAKLDRQADFLDYWTSVREECVQLADEMAMRERSLNARVYEIYGVDAADIAIIEGYFEDRGL